MSRFSLLIFSLCGLLVPSAANCGETETYAYDSKGRLTHAGSGPDNTRFYLYDGAENRRVVRCCASIGGWQVKVDGFDPYYYLQTYPDIRVAGIDPYAHWLQWGNSENRNPNQFFDTQWYRTTYGLPASANALTDYHESGWRLGRNPSTRFSTTAYHSKWADTAPIDPLQHYLRWGYGEGRSIN